MRFLRLLLAALLFSAALYVFLLGPDSRAELLASFGITLKHTTATVMSIQGMVVGVVLAIKALLEDRTMRHT